MGCQSFHALLEYQQHLVNQARMAHEILKEFHLKLGAIVNIDDCHLWRKCGEFPNYSRQGAWTDVIRYNVRLKPSKCSFGMVSIEFLGHLFDQNGSCFTEERVQGICDLEEPNSVAVRSFVGMVNYFRDYISDLFGCLVPLTALTKKSWTSEPFLSYGSARLGSAGF
jgi:hypothetical protein